MEIVSTPQPNSYCKVYYILMQSEFFFFKFFLTKIKFSRSQNVFAG